jgi:hypothetical protein
MTIPDYDEECDCEVCVDDRKRRQQRRIEEESDRAFDKMVGSIDMWEMKGYRRK